MQILSLFDVNLTAVKINYNLKLLVKLKKF
jgi:hypothetical protein